MPDGVAGTRSGSEVSSLMKRGKRLGMMPVAGLEALENKHCRLATTRQDVAYEQICYNDFHHIAVGRWTYGLGNYKM